MFFIKYIKKIPGVRCLRRYRLKQRWRKKNKDNFTTIGKYNFDINKVSVGKGTYGEINVKQFEKNCCELTIGNYCSIAPEVVFLVDGEHSYKNISTYPFATRYFHKNIDTKSKGSITIDDDVWIGYRATILSGVHIGKGAVIGAGALVTSNIPPYAIVGGVPSKVLKYRFTEDLIDELMKIDFNVLSLDDIEDNLGKLYEELLSVEQIDWLKK